MVLWLFVVCLICLFKFVCFVFFVLFCSVCFVFVSFFGCLFIAGARNSVMILWLVHCFGCLFVIALVVCLTVCSLTCLFVLFVGFCCLLFGGMWMWRQTLWPTTSLKGSTRKQECFQSREEAAAPREAGHSQEVCSHAETVSALAAQMRCRLRRGTLIGIITGLADLQRSCVQETGTTGLAELLNMILFADRASCHFALICIWTHGTLREQVHMNVSE